MKNFKQEDGLENDAELMEALASFKSRVHAWSDAAYTRPRAAVSAPRSGWRVALGWALGCVLVAGSVSGGVFEHRHSLALARMAAAQRAADQAAADHEKQLRAAKAAAVPDDDLLAGVNSDLARQVPSALEPMAQMMQEGDTK